MPRNTNGARQQRKNYTGMFFFSRSPRQDARFLLCMWGKKRGKNSGHNKGNTTQKRRKKQEVTSKGSWCLRHGRDHQAIHHRPPVSSSAAFIPFARRSVHSLHPSCGNKSRKGRASFHPESRNKKRRKKVKKKHIRQDGGYKQVYQSAPRPSRSLGGNQQQTYPGRPPSPAQGEASRSAAG